MAIQYFRDIFEGNYVLKTNLVLTTNDYNVVAHLTIQVGSVNNNDSFISFYSDTDPLVPKGFSVNIAVLDENPVDIADIIKKYNTRNHQYFILYSNELKTTDFKGSKQNLLTAFYYTFNNIRNDNNRP